SRLSNGSRQLFPHEYLPADLLYAPARNRIECRRTQDFSGPQTKAGMMQRAPQFVAHDEPTGQRSAVVRTMRAHREEFIAATSDDHIFITGPSLGHRAIRNLSDPNSGATISFCPAIHIPALSLFPPSH